MELNEKFVNTLIREGSAGRILAKQIKAMSDYMRNAHPEIFQKNSGPAHDNINIVVDFIDKCIADYDKYSKGQINGERV